MTDKFCFYCGEKLIKDGIAYYQTKNGIPVYGLMCPKNKTSIWVKIFPFIRIHDMNETELSR